MYFNHYIRQRLVACILLLSLFLQSCWNQSIEPITNTSAKPATANSSSPKDKKEKDIYEKAAPPILDEVTVRSRTSQDIASENTQLMIELANKIFIAQRGHPVKFRFVEGKFTAVVKEESSNRNFLKFIRNFNVNSLIYR